jgi:hypothetical protein
LTIADSAKPGAKKKGWSMLQSLWEAAKKRPTRSLGIAALIMTLGATIHFYVSGVALLKLITQATSLRSVTESAAVVARVEPFATVIIYADIACLFVGVILGSLFLWRFHRGLP